MFKIKNRIAQPFLEEVLRIQITISDIKENLTLCRIGIFKGPSYPAIMKLGTVVPYLKKIQKIFESRDALL